VAISANGTYAAASDTNGGIFFFHSPQQATTPFWRYQSDSAIEALAMSEDGDYLVAGDRQGAIYLFKAELTDPLVWKYVIPGGITAISLSTSGSLAVTGTQGGVYFFGSVLSLSSYAWVFGEYMSFPQVRMSNDAGYVVAGASDGYVYLVNASGQLMDRQRLGGGVSALSMSSATHLMVAGSNSGNLSLYSIGTGLDRLDSFDTGRPVFSVAISESGQRIAVADLDGAVLMFGQSFASLMWTFGAGAIVHLLSMSKDGQVMAAVSDTGGVYLFDETLMSPNQLPEVGMFMPVVAIVAVAFFTVVGYFMWRRRGRGTREEKTYRSR
jgi:WD40 repeat protein